MATDERQFKAFSQALAMTIIQTPLLNSFHQLWATLFDTLKSGFLPKPDTKNNLLPLHTPYCERA